MSLRFWPTRVLPLPPIEARSETSAFGQKLFVVGARSGKQSIARAWSREHGGVVLFHSPSPVANLRGLTRDVDTGWR